MISINPDELIPVLEKNPWTTMLILFYTTTCNKCHFWMDELDKLDWVDVFKCDIQDSAEAINKFNIQSVPTLIKFVNGIEENRIEEVQPNSVVKEVFELEKAEE